MSESGSRQTDAHNGFQPQRITALDNPFDSDAALNSHLLVSERFYLPIEESTDEQLIATVLGWALGHLNVPTWLDSDHTWSILSLRWHYNHLGVNHTEPCVPCADYAVRIEEENDPDDEYWAEHRVRTFAHWDELGVRGDTMLPGHVISNAGIEEDTLARIWLRVIRVHDFLIRFTGVDELDGEPDPGGIYEMLMHCDDELLTDVWVWFVLHHPNPAGTFHVPASTVRSVEMLIADEAEAIRRSFGVPEEDCAAHPAEAELRMRVAELHARYAPRPPISGITLALEEFRRANGVEPDDEFWTEERVRTAYGLNLS